MSEPHTITTENGRSFLVDEYGNMQAIYNEVEQPERNQRSSVRFYDSFQQEMVRNIQEGEILRVPLQYNAVWHDESASDNSDYSFVIPSPDPINYAESEPIENLNYDLMVSIAQDMSNRRSGREPNHLLRCVLHEYNQQVAENPQFRHMGNTQRFRIYSNGSIELRESNRRVRARARSNRPDSRSSLYEWYSNQIQHTGFVTSGYAHVDVSSIPTTGEVIRPSNTPMQTLSKVCLHQECIKCNGQRVDGRGRACEHNFTCQCYICVRGS